MARETIKIGVDVDRETDLTLRSWSKERDRSKRRHSAVTLKNVARFRRMAQDELKRLSADDILRRLELVQ